MPAEDKDLAIRCRREFVRRQGIDSRFLEITAMRGVVTLRGELRPVRGQDIDLQHELEVIMQNIRRISGVRDVRNDVGVRAPTIRRPTVTRKSWDEEETAARPPEDFD
jgi:osmotically-inducible protein OsmY